MTEIHAIETAYKGYRFRSRLEARWAVFFDALHIPWEYELQGFALGDLGNYLPDFYLPSWKTWLEVKPGYLLTARERLPERERIILLCQALSRQPSMVMVSYGLPGKEKVIVFHDGYPVGGGQFMTRYVGPPVHCTGLCIAASNEADHWIALDMEEGLRVTTLVDAQLTASQARFEYGETPHALG